jgi:hypothetical protein
MIRIWHMENDHKNENPVGAGISYRLNASLDIITFLKRVEGKPVDSLQIDMRPLLDKLLQEYSNTNISNIPPETMSMSPVNPSMKIKMYLRYLNLHREDKMVKIVNFGADILF